MALSIMLNDNYVSLLGEVELAIEGDDNVQVFNALCHSIKATKDTNVELTPGRYVVRVNVSILKDDTSTNRSL